MIDIKNWNPAFASAATPPATELSSAIATAEQAEAEAERKNKPAVKGKDMSKFKQSVDVTGHLADDGETVVAPLRGKSSKEVFYAHHNLDASGNPPAGVTVATGPNACQCLDCQTYSAEQQS